MEYFKNAFKSDAKDLCDVNLDSFIELVDLVKGMNNFNALGSHEVMKRIMMAIGIIVQQPIEGIELPEVGMGQFLFLYELSQFGDSWKVSISRFAL